MKTKKQIQEKIESLSKDLENYKENWDNFEHNYHNGVVKKIEEDTLYVSIVNQLEVLNWVLKD